MKTIHEWLSEYGESHKNETNKVIHWICVPAIFFSIVGIFYGVKLPYQLGIFRLNVAAILLSMVIIYYSFLSRTIWVGMLFFGFACLGLSQIIESSGIIPLWLCCLLIFVFAWIGQFYGHKVEGEKPSFLKDLQFLLIGPAWLMSHIYHKLGIRL
jgi:uncharacterized membrane protein YGL010W